MAMDDDGFERERLHRAAADADIPLAKQLIAQGCDVHARDFMDRTPLHHAVQYGHVEMIELLLAHGADVNAHYEPKIGETPLGEVAETCSLEVAKLLLDAGADPTIPGWMQLTALDRASKRKRGDGPKVYELLRRYTERRTERFKQKK